MFGSNVLEVVISVIFVYILLSLLCTTINEHVIVRILSLRSKILQEGITNMLGDPVLVQQFYNHPLILALSRDTLYSKPARTTPVTTPNPTATTQTPKIRKPSYIPADIFAIALKDVLEQQREAQSATTFSIPSNLEIILKKLNIDLQTDLLGLETWFNTTMERVSGWYKRRVQLFILLMGFVVAAGLNIDTVSLITTVSNNQTVRATLVSAAQGYTTQHSPDLNLLQGEINQVQPMVGWYTLPEGFQGWLLKVVGLMTTTFAVSLGAPFWFDILNKCMSFRSSGPPPSPKSSVLSSPSSVVVVKNDMTPTTPLPQDVTVGGTDSSSNGSAQTI